MTRREWLCVATAPAAFAKAPKVRLSLGNYGMQGMLVDAALATIQRIGYDGAELCLMAGWPSEPAKLDAGARRRIREQPLPIPSLLENLNLLVSDADHQEMLDRIRAAAAVAHDVAAKDPPLLQTVLGGKPPDWESVKEQMVSRLTEWATVAEASSIRLAVKAHVGSACHTPEKLIWLLDRVHHPFVRGIYDYSHFQLLGLDLEKSLTALLPKCAFVTVKDSRSADGRPQFLLPGDGTMDYARYFSLLASLRYEGWMLVEVSRQLQVAPGYDANFAAERSYRFLAPRLRDSKLRQKD